MKNRALIALSLFVISSLVLTACGGTGASSLRSDVAAAMNLLNTSGPYRMRIESVATGLTDVQLVDVVPPNDMHMRSEVPGLEEQIEIIRIGNKAWIREGAAFVESAVSPDSQEAFSAAPFVGGEFMKYTSDHAALPEQVIGSTKAKGYSFVFTDLDGSKSKYELWTSADKNQPLKITIVYEELKQNYTFEYDGAIKIAPPTL